MKTCTKCKILKEFKCFSKNSNKKDGLFNICKECKSIDYELSGKRKTLRLKTYGPKDKEKICTKCKTEKKVEEFNIDRSRRCGTHPWCKECSKSLRKPYFDSLNQKEETKKYKKEWHERNKDRMLKLAKERNKKNRIINNAKAVKKSKTNLQFKMSGILRKRICKIISGHTKSGSSIKDLGCTLEYFLLHIESLFQPGMTWDNHGSGPGYWELDHVKALLNFDLSDREQFLKACHYTNMQPLWYEDHKNKTLKDIENYKKAKK